MFLGDMTKEEYDELCRERPDLCLCPSVDLSDWIKKYLLEYTRERIITERTAQILAMGERFCGLPDFFFQSVNDPDFKWP